ncbi:MAG: ABC transporter permease [Patescibacteria group bacterium]
MHIADSFKTAVIGLKTNKTRSALTVLGIVIGITAIIVVMGVGAGAQNLILDQMQGFGTKMIDIEPGRETTGPSSVSQMFTDSLKVRDVEMLKKMPGVEKVAPSVFTSSVISYDSETKDASIYGSSDLVIEILGVTVGQGRPINDFDIKQNSKVAVIGSELADAFFGFDNPLGKKIKIKNTSFEVIGVFNKKGSMMGFNIDEMALIPYTTAQKYLLGINYFNGGIIVQVKDESMVNSMTEEIKVRLRELHNITDPDKDDFHVVTQADAMDSVNMITSILTALLSSVAAISLIVGGIGIMNIMLVSVTERTREIGLRKAVGATTRDIMVQFILESVILTLIGGILGILFGALFSYLVALILSSSVAEGWRFAMPLSAVLLGLGVSAGIGLIFGLYPAKQASKKSPIEALRYE